ncbi:MAG: type III-B CRISPR-associated protein Cas10/Cmr2, partial [Hydrogenobacter sp.]
MLKKLLIFSFSPVQGFISASRRPRDLFTGSYIISYLTERVIKDLGLKDKVIYPVIKEEGSHLANYPNKFIAVVEENMCDEVEGKFREIWKGICEEVWKGLELKHAEDQFWRHVDNYFNPVCSCLEFLDKDSWEDILGVSENLEGEPYAFTYDLLERLLGAKKSWRPYRGVVDAHTFKGKYPNGCTMCGERLHLAIDWDNKKEFFKEKDARHIREGEKLCGVCLVKRFAVKYYFKNHFGKDLWHYPSTEEVAGINFKKKLRKFRDEIKEDYKKLVGKLQETPYIIRNPIIKT